MIIYNYQIIDQKLFGHSIKLPSGSYHNIKLHFDFPEEYKKFRCYAYFTYKNNFYRIVLDDENSVFIPYNITKEACDFKFGFVAYEVFGNNLKERFVSNPLEGIIYKALNNQEISPDDPTATSEWEKFNLEMEKIQNQLDEALSSVWNDIQQLTQRVKALEDERNK